MDATMQGTAPNTGVDTSWVHGRTLIPRAAPFRLLLDSLISQREGETSVNSVPSHTDTLHITLRAYNIAGMT